MSLPENIAPLLQPISALQRFMDRLGGRGVIIGGVATGFHGKPRLTVDVDAMVLASVDDISKLLILAKEEGIEPRIENMDGFARRNRILLLHHTATKTNIDISLGILPFEEEIVERSIRFWMESESNDGSLPSRKHSNSPNYGDRLNGC